MVTTAICRYSSCPWLMSWRRTPAAADPGPGPATTVAAGRVAAEGARSQPPAAVAATQSTPPTGHALTTRGTRVGRSWVGRARASGRAGHPGVARPRTRRSSGHPGRRTATRVAVRHAASPAATNNTSATDRYATGGRSHAWALFGPAARTAPVATAY